MTLAFQIATACAITATFGLGLFAVAFPQSRPPVHFVIVQTVALCLFAAAWWLGWPQMMYEADPTKLTAVIGAAGLMGVLAEGFRYHRVTDHLIGSLPAYGLLGTVIGLSMVARSAGQDFDAVLAGLATAFFTTATGIVSMEWLKITRALA